MTLFTYRDLWSIDINEPPNFISPRSIVSGNIDNNEDDECLLVIGSLSGYLRIIGGRYGVDDPGEPSSNDNDGYSEVSEQAVILAEFHLGNPILQVEAERFVGGSDKVTIAILHPLKLSIFSISKLPGQVEHGSQYKLSLLYEHGLKRHAFNMCSGAFGSGSSSKPLTTSNLTNHHIKSTPTPAHRQFICIQSLDGTLSFFEQEVFTFSRYIPDIMIPGQIAYVGPWDSFVIGTSSWNLVCFKYSSLAMAKDDVYRSQDQDSAVGKKLIPDWIVSVGEEFIGEFQVLVEEGQGGNSAKLIVCTFRNLYCFKELGELVWSKKLEYHVNSFCSYVVRSSSNHYDNNQQITLAASGNDPYTCFIYNGTALRWAAKLPICPILISKVSLNGVDGGVLILNSEGKLILGYLGTEPSLFVAPPVMSRDLDYEAAEKELVCLRKVISESGEQNPLNTKDTTVDIKVEFEGHKTKILESGLEVFCLIGKIKILCRLRVNDLRVTVSTTNPIVCQPQSSYVGDIIGRHTIPVEFHLDGLALPCDLSCDIIGFYFDGGAGGNEVGAGAPKFSIKRGVKIPLFIVCKGSGVVEKEADCKLTFSVNKGPVDLLQVYNDFDWGEGSEASGTCICFRFYDGSYVTLLCSTKTGGGEVSKYRIQGNVLSGVYVVYKDFWERLGRKFGKKGFVVEVNNAVSLNGGSEDIPFLGEFFSELDCHLLRKEREVKIRGDLGDRAGQFRAVQRRLLVRFRDRNPVPLSQLELLLGGSLEQILDCVSFIELNREEMYKSECRLSGAVRMVVELMGLKKKRGEDGVDELIVSALSPFVWGFSEEFGWEECVYSSFMFLKSGIVSGGSSGGGVDGKKFKKVVKGLLEKGVVLGKGGGGSSGVEEAPNLLVGNELQERMTSARGRRGGGERGRGNGGLEVIHEPDGEGIGGDDEAGEGLVGEIAQKVEVLEQSYDSDDVLRNDQSGYELIDNEEPNILKKNDEMLVYNNTGAVESNIVNNNNNADENFW